jgi:hypothetical protein
MSFHYLLGFIMASGLEFTAREDPPGKMLQSFIDARDYKRLATIMLTIVNRCFRAIRHAGMVYNVNEIPEIEDQEAEPLLGLWGTKVSVDGLSWTLLSQQWGAPSLRPIINFWAVKINPGRLNFDRWAEIEEAIRDDLPVLPEQEFTLNAIEHLHVRNFRLALVESIIGLEIVLSRYLSAYLRLHKKVPQSRIKGFLSPQLTLNSRLSVLLDLTLPQDVLQQINLGHVRKAVGWRNKVIHDTGQLPRGIPHAELTEAIAAVLDLIHLLAELTPGQKGTR